MKEILFRGKRLKSPHDWVKGGFCERYYSPFDVSFHKAIMLHSGGFYSSGVPVFPQTVGQFTTCYDCEGKPIFEGDIIEPTYAHNDGLIRVVEWDRFQWTMRAAGSNLPEHEYGGRMWVYQCRVIGNIYDNPELLNG